MSGVIYWVGMIHIIMYVLLGGSALIVFALNRAYKNLSVTGRILQMHAKVLREERQQKDPRP
ncbi:hypothetical protein ASE81_11590 [Sphingomonas sp. Leaf29]|nr:hypothetical protein ASE81_11590 [Sphingomonas sp. Leaf29]